MSALENCCACRAGVITSGINHFPCAWLQEARLIPALLYTPSRSTDREKAYWLLLKAWYSRECRPLAEHHCLGKKNTDAAHLVPFFQPFPSKKLFFSEQISLHISLPFHKLWRRSKSFMLIPDHKKPVIHRYKLNISDTDRYEADGGSWSEGKARKTLHGPPQINTAYCVRWWM